MDTYQPRSVPREGLSSPVFDGMGVDELIVSMSFSPGLTDQQRHLVYRWFRSADAHAATHAHQGAGGAPGGGSVSAFSTVTPFANEHLLHVRLGNLPDPRVAVIDLIGELTAAGVRIKDCFFARWRLRGDGVMGPCRDPRAPAEVPGSASLREYLDRLWDPASGPPPSELDSDLRGGFLAGDEMILEHRAAPLFFPGVRVGYGLAPVTYQIADERTEQVRRVLVDALARGWQRVFRAPGKWHVRPQPLDRDGNVDSVEKITCGSRAGYTFAVQCVQLLDRPSPGTCRFREYELLEAVLEVVDALALAPVVTWQRFGTPLAGPVRRPDQVVIQVWEPGGDHSSQPDLDRDPGAVDEDDYPDEDDLADLADLDGLDDLDGPDDLDDLDEVDGEYDDVDALGDGGDGGEGDDRARGQTAPADSR